MTKIVPIILSRLLWVIPTIIGLITITFVLSRFIPADPVALAAGEAANLEQIEALRERLGYDQPIVEQFFAYLRNVAVGDLGQSLFTGREIVQDLADRLPATIELILVSMFAAVFLGIPLGILSAVKRSTLIDHVVRIVSVAGLALASFWPAIIITTHDLASAYQLCDRVMVMYAGQEMEGAETDTFFRRPGHPYTHGLLESTPEKDQDLRGITGDIPNLAAPPQGCRFHTRCVRVDERCKAQRPPVAATAGRHFIRCFNPHLEPAEP